MADDANVHPTGRWTHAETMRGIAEAQQLVPTALRVVQLLLMEIHQQEYSTEYVQLVHGMWATHLCHEVVYQRGQGESSKTMTDSVVLLPTSKPTYPSREESGVLSRTALVQLVMHDAARVHDLQLRAQRDEPSSPSLVRICRDELLSTFATHDAPVWVSEPYLQLGVGARVQAAWRSRRLMSWHDLNGTKSCEVSPHLRARTAFAARSSHDDSSVGLLAMLVALTLPIEMAEALPAIANEVAPLCSRKPRAIYTANSQHYRIPFKVAAARLTADGSKLLVHQHGGGYGIDELHVGEQFDRSIADRFFTFGWTDEIDQTVVPLPTPHRAKRERVSRHVLVVCAEHITEFFRFQSFCLPEHSSRALQETRAFLGHMNSIGDLYIRMAPSGPVPLALLGDVSTNCKIADSSESGAVAMSRAGLVVHNYLGTSWLESLSMDVPTVCFYDPEFFRPRAAARPLLEALARVGVLHYSGSEAAKFVNSLRGDPSAWWRSAEVQEAREAFVARYANFSDNWLEAWTEEFERLLA